jgi:hypothetical protein
MKVSKRTWMLAALVTAGSVLAQAAIKDRPLPDEKPPLVSSSATPPPALPQFAQGPRRLVTPAPALTPRIPNLLVTPRKYAQASLNSGTSPAAPIVTAPVNNVEGTGVLPMLAPFRREITIEIAPPAAPLAFDREPYLQAAGAADDEDAPAAGPADAPGKPRVN